MSQPSASPPPEPPRPGEPPSGPPPYYPPPPGPPPYQQPPPGSAEPPKTLAILALVFGGAALLFALIPFAGIFLGGLFGIAAIVLGIMGIFKSHRLMSIIGIALAVVGLIVAVVITVAVGRSAEEIIEDWPTDYGDTTGEDEGHGDAPQDQVVDGTDPTAPLPAGSEITTGNWTVVLSDVVSDATEQVLAENQFNVPPAEGYQYFMFQVEATYQGESSSTAWADLLFGVYVDGSVYSESCGVIPGDLVDAPEVFAGGTATGSQCIAVPTAGLETAAIGVEDYWASGQRYFVAAS